VTAADAWKPWQKVTAVVTDTGQNVAAGREFQGIAPTTETRGWGGSVEMCENPEKTPIAMVNTPRNDAESGANRCENSPNFTHPSGFRREPTAM
jgi:hypothetical protein